jgi:hypothetical protein
MGAFLISFKLLKEDGIDLAMVSVEKVSLPISTNYPLSNIVDC